MAKKTERKSLGRGLSALLADVNLDEGSNAQAVASTQLSDTNVPIEKVFANPDQPRRTFIEKDLDELTASIAEKGVIQPLIVAQYSCSDPRSDRHRGVGISHNRKYPARRFECG